MILWNLKTPLSLLASFIWNLSELFNVPLRGLAPTVFHAMIGAKRKKTISNIIK